jgi:hypothetical protein
VFKRLSGRSAFSLRKSLLKEKNFVKRAFVRGFCKKSLLEERLLARRTRYNKDK